MVYLETRTNKLEILYSRKIDHVDKRRKDFIKNKRNIKEDVLNDYQSKSKLKCNQKTRWPISIKMISENYKRELPVLKRI